MRFIVHIVLIIL
jgi:hypothetical protein